jgi:sugar phosphate isomerase/epimerase
VRYGLIHYNAPGKTVAEFLDYAKETGFDWVELQCTDVWAAGEEDPESRAAEVKALLDARGMKASALSAHNDFVVLGADEIKAEVERMKRVCELAQILGTDVLRTEGGQPKDSVPEAKWADAIIGCLVPCCEFIEPMGIKLAVDNHGWVTNDGDLQLKVFETVASPNVGSNLDTMNFRWFGNDLETIDRYYRQLASYVFHTHLKDGTGARENYKGAALGDGEIHLDLAVKCLVDAGYEGVWCAEYEGPPPTGEGYAKCLKWMRANCPG